MLFFKRTKENKKTNQPNKQSQTHTLIPTPFLMQKDKAELRYLPPEGECALTGRGLVNRRFSLVLENVSDLPWSLETVAKGKSKPNTGQGKSRADRTPTSFPRGSVWRSHSHIPGCGAPGSQGSLLRPRQQAPGMTGMGFVSLRLHTSWEDSSTQDRPLNQPDLETGLQHTNGPCHQPERGRRHKRRRGDSQWVGLSRPSLSRANTQSVTWDEKPDECQGSNHEYGGALMRKMTAEAFTVPLLLCTLHDRRSISRSTSEITSQTRFRWSTHTPPTHNDNDR